MEENWDFLFKCDYPSCVNETSDLFWVNCKFCDRFFHTQCIGLPNKDYKTIRCVHCYLYMKGLGPPVPPKEPMAEHLVEAYVAYYRRMFDEILQTSERVYNPAVESRYTNGNGRTRLSGSESASNDSSSYCGSSCSCNNTESSDPLSPYHSTASSEVEEP